MNRALYNASAHLLEASKHLSNVEQFQEEAIQLLKMSETMASIIVPEKQKVSDEKMLSILDEILK